MGEGREQLDALICALDEKVQIRACGLRLAFPNTSRSVTS